MITLIIPPSPFLINDKVFLSLGPLYVAAILEKKGYAVRVIELAGNPDWEEKLKKEVKQKDELIGLTATTADFPMAIKILKIIKSVNKETPVAIGGAHATIAPEQCKMFDKVIVGDGFTGIFLALESDQKIVHGTMVDNLDELPLPARHLVDIDSYHYEINGRKATNVISQLGCPFNCAFCCGRNIKEYRTVRYRSPESFINELDYLNKTYGFNAFMIHDDEFNLNKARTLKICDALSKRNYVFRGFVRSDLFTEEIAAAMAKAGFYQIDVGVESGSPRILKVINKMTTPEMNSRARMLAKKYGIKFKCFITIGHPSETREDIEMTKNWLIDNKPDAFEIYVITPYPGSPLYDNKEKYDIQFNIDFLNEITPVTRKDGEQLCYVSNSHLNSEELVKIRDEVDKEVRKKLGLLTAQQIAEKIGRRVHTDEIDGVVVKSLKRIVDERGAIFHMLRRSDKEFDEFGEIYFSIINKGFVKGWHVHTRMVLNYAVVMGNIRLVLYDARPNSSTKGNIFEIDMGEDNYVLVKVPSGVWNGFKGLTKKAIVANCATIPHDPEEIKRLDPKSKEIPYDWGRIKKGSG